MIEALLHSMIICPDMTRKYACISHGKGVYLFDTKGRKYIDASAGSAAVANLGYGLTVIGDIIACQAKRVAVLPTHIFSSEIVEEYLKKLVAFAPPGFKRAWTVMSGTEAVENAAKVAIQYHQLKGDNKRYKIISRWFSYHGNSIFTLDIGGMKYRRQSYAKWMNNFPHVSPAYAYRHAGDLTEIEYLNKCMRELRETIENNDPETIAAFIAEPVVGAALGAVLPPSGYFEAVRQICDEYGILFIVDEVMTGFGRLGTNFGMERFNVIPDIIATGKGISGGYFPLSAVIVHEKVSNEFEDKSLPFLGGHTFACNPLGAAVGSFVIDFMQSNDVLNNVMTIKELLAEQLFKLKRHRIVGDVRGAGLLWGLEFVKDRYTKEPFLPDMKVSRMIFEEGLKRGAIFYPGSGSVDGVSGDHILLSPPLIVSKNEVYEICHILSESIEAVDKMLLG